MNIIKLHNTVYVVCNIVWYCNIVVTSRNKYYNIIYSSVVVMFGNEHYNII